MRTFDHIRKRKDLTEPQRKGLIYFDDIQQRIPRQEVLQFEQRMQRVIHSFGVGLQGHVLGSFRRGAETCGDVDFMS